MLDFRISSHSHFDDACSKFAATHNVKELAVKAGIKPHTLYNKLNPEQPHQLTPREIWMLTDLTEDATLMDGFNAQMNCLPVIPINELASEKLQDYVLAAMASVGNVASGSIVKERMTKKHKLTFVDSVNKGMRFLALAALSVDARLKTNPAMTSAVDTMTGIGATFGLL